MRQRRQQPGGFKERRQQRKTERTKQRQEHKTEHKERKQRQEHKAERTKQRQEHKTQRIERREQHRRDRRLRVKRAVVGTNRFLGRTRPPLPDPDFVETPTRSARLSVLSAMLFLSVAALMVSGKIVEIADRLPLGADRDRWVAAAESTDRVGNWLSLNRPYDALRDLRGAGEDAGQRVDVIGDLEDLLAAGVGQDSRSSSATSTPTSTDIPSDGTLTAVTEEPSAAVAADDSDHQPSMSGETLEDPQDPNPATIAAQQDPNPATIAAQQDPADSIGDTADVAEDPTAATDGGPGTLSGELQTTSGALIDPMTTAGTEQPAVEPGEEDALDPLEESERLLIEPRLTPVSEEAPLRAYVAGDSQAFYLGVELRAGPLRRVIEVTLENRHSTGLARPAYFNWPAHLLSVSTELDPELLVMTMGNNDWQDMRSQDDEILRRGSDQWRAEWGRRLGVMFDLMAAPHRHIVWVGLPPTRRDDFREGYAVMNEVAVEVAAERDFVTMIDIWEMFGGDESYRASVPPPGDPGGNPVLVRQTDGVHLNRRGAEWVVAIVEEEIRRIWDPVDG